VLSVIHGVLAHGPAMVFGFVGFFIMGFAYQAVPRFKHAALWRPRLAFSSLPLMIAGIILQTIAHLLSPPSLPLEIFASAIQMAAAIIFSVVMMQRGFPLLRNPVLRKTMARAITIEQACRREGLIW
jgi:Domain of unknown function (DUF1858)